MQDLRLALCPLARREADASEYQKRTERDDGGRLRNRCGFIRNTYLTITAIIGFITTKGTAAIPDDSGGQACSK